jgi:transcriptional regulator GlxA family with amidase domain
VLLAFVSRYVLPVGSRLSWAAIAAATGYYDQAHLIEEFRAIAGVTPRVLLSELGAAYVGQP